LVATALAATLAGTGVVLVPEALPMLSDFVTELTNLMREAIGALQNP
jgi:hypothetical protein